MFEGLTVHQVVSNHNLVCPPTCLNSAAHPSQIPFAEVMAGIDAGWFPDPVGPNNERYWDGSSWTDSARIAVPPAECDGSGNQHEPLRLQDFEAPIEPLLLNLLATSAVS